MVCAGATDELDLLDVLGAEVLVLLGMLLLVEVFVDVEVFWEVEVTSGFLLEDSDFVPP